MNDDWKYMFGRSATDTTPGKMLLPADAESSQNCSLDSNDTDFFHTNVHRTPISLRLQRSSDSQHSNHELSHSSGVSRSVRSNTHDPMMSSEVSDVQQSQVAQSQCEANLADLVLRKVQLFESTDASNDSLHDRPVCIAWKPKGQLVAHLHEHRGAVNRIQVFCVCSCPNKDSFELYFSSR